jgi:hypothetical protein
MRPDYAVSMLLDASKFVHMESFAWFARAISLAINLFACLVSRRHAAHLSVLVVFGGERAQKSRDFKHISQYYVI